MKIYTNFTAPEDPPRARFIGFYDQREPCPICGIKTAMFLSSSEWPEPVCLTCDGWRFLIWDRIGPRRIGAHES
jgi:hypothetical protein